MTWEEGLSAIGRPVRTKSGAGHRLVSIRDRHLDGGVAMFGRFNGVEQCSSLRLVSLYNPDKDGDEGVWFEDESILEEPA